MGIRDVQQRALMRKVQRRQIMARVEQFTDYISAHAPDAPVDLLQFFIQESVTDFLIDTKLATSFSVLRCMKKSMTMY